MSPRGAAPKAAPRSAVPADSGWVARVVVDVQHAHLDRTFDYLVTADQDAAASVGSRVRVRFAGRLIDGFIAERSETTEHVGKLAPLERVVTSEPILDPVLLGDLRAVADRWAGTVADVLRLAIPPRSAAAESAESAALPEPPARPEAGTWSGYGAGASFVKALGDGKSPRAVWIAAPGERWGQEIAIAAQATASSGRGVLIVVPDLRELGSLDRVLRQQLGKGQHVVLHSELGPKTRYERWLAVRRGAVRIVLGTRAAAYAPLAELGLVVCWDEGSDLHDEPRSPYANARDVLALRAHRHGAGALLGGFSVSVEARQLLDGGWAKLLALPKEGLRDAMPRVRAVGEDRDLARDVAARAARIPSVAWQAAQDALKRDEPVLVQVARRGYQPGLACVRCRTAARCTVCAGPLRRKAANAPLGCGWCGAVAGAYRCPECDSTELRATTVGSARTAEELGRAFPNVPVRVSAGDAVLERVPGGRSLVIATTGGEPVADGGYGAALLLDANALLARPDIRAAEEALRRWLNAAALVRPASQGGEVIVVADAAIPAVQALVRWDPLGYAEREAAERASLGFPPAVRVGVLDGEPAAVNEAILSLALPASAQILGPVPLANDEERAIVRIERAKGAELAEAFRVLASSRSARKVQGKLRIRLDPRELI